MDINVSKLKKGILSVLIANIINLCIKVATSFILPKYLSVDSYAALKTYHLYVAYAGVLSFGYIDGMFLKYGGIDFDQLDKKDLNRNLSSFRIFQLIVVALLFVIGCYFRDIILMAFLATTFPTNMAGYFKSLYQSIGEFQRYSRIMNATTGITFLINLLLLFVVRTDDFRLYLLLYVLLNLVIWLFLELYLRKSCKFQFSYTVFSVQETIANIKDGILLMLGNFSNIILTSMDRWFIKFLMSTTAFAQYSFACSMENFVNLSVTPLTVTLYNYFCKVRDVQKIQKVRNIVLLFGSVLIACAFPGKFVLEIYLDKYLEASDVMFYLFAAQLFYLLIKSVYVNLYKAYHKQTRYFIRLVTVIVAGFVFNIGCYTVFSCKESFAVGTLLTSILWLFLSNRDFEWLSFGWRESIYLAIAAGSFLLCGNSLGAIPGCVVYLLVISISAAFLMRSELLYILENGKEMLKHRKQPKK